jgi:hypothetical protein
MMEKTIRISIATTKDKAEQDHLKAAETNANDPNLLDIHTDGSGIEGHIGAAAYAPKPQAVKHQYLGPDTTANVFTAELIAVKLAIGTLGEEEQPPSNCTIYADS